MSNNSRIQFVEKAFENGYILTPLHMNTKFPMQYKWNESIHDADIQERAKLILKFEVCNVGLILTNDLIAIDIDDDDIYNSHFTLLLKKSSIQRRGRRGGVFLFRYLNDDSLRSPKIHCASAPSNKLIDIKLTGTQIVLPPSKFIDLDDNNKVYNYHYLNDNTIINTKKEELYTLNESQFEEILDARELLIKELPKEKLEFLRKEGEKGRHINLRNLLLHEALVINADESKIDELTQFILNKDASLYPANPYFHDKTEHKKNAYDVAVKMVKTTIESTAFISRSKANDEFERGLLSMIESEKKKEVEMNIEIKHESSVSNYLDVENKFIEDSFPDLTYYHKYVYDLLYPYLKYDTKQLAFEIAEQLIIAYTMGYLHFNRKSTQKYTLFLAPSGFQKDLLKTATSLFKEFIFEKKNKKIKVISSQNYSARSIHNGFENDFKLTYIINDNENLLRNIFNASSDITAYLLDAWSSFSSYTPLSIALADQKNNPVTPISDAMLNFMITIQPAIFNNVYETANKLNGLLARFNIQMVRISWLDTKLKVYTNNVPLSVWDDIFAPFEYLKLNHLYEIPSTISNLSEIEFLNNKKLIGSPEYLRPSLERVNELTISQAIRLAVSQSLMLNSELKLDERVYYESKKYIDYSIDCLIDLNSADSNFSNKRKETLKDMKWLENKFIDFVYKLKKENKFQFTLKEFYRAKTLQKAGFNAMDIESFLNNQGLKKDELGKFVIK